MRKLDQAAGLGELIKMKQWTGLTASQQLQASSLRVWSINSTEIDFKPFTSTNNPCSLIRDMINISKSLMGSERRRGSGFL